jgi:hypothetical protein
MIIELKSYIKNLYYSPAAGEESYALSFTGSSDHIVLKETICFHKTVKTGWFNKKYLALHKASIHLLSYGWLRMFLTKKQVK